MDIAAKIYQARDALAGLINEAIGAGYWVSADVKALADIRITETAKAQKQAAAQAAPVAAEEAAQPEPEDEAVARVSRAFSFGKKKD